MELPHEMVCEAETASEALFVCADGACGRRVVVGKGRPAFTVIDRGNFAARHMGGTGGVTMSPVLIG
jgi:hypothetical protein